MSVTRFLKANNKRLLYGTVIIHFKASSGGRFPYRQSSSRKTQQYNYSLPTISPLIRTIPNSVLIPLFPPIIHTLLSSSGQKNPKRNNQGYSLSPHDLVHLTADIIAQSPATGLDQAQVHMCLKSTYTRFGSSLRAKVATKEQVERIQSWASLEGVSGRTGKSLSTWLRGRQGGMEYERSQF